MHENFRYHIYIMLLLNYPADAKIQYFNKSLNSRRRFLNITFKIYNQSKIAFVNVSVGIKQYVTSSILELSFLNRHNLSLDFNQNHQCQLKLSIPHFNVNLTLFLQILYIVEFRWSFGVLLYEIATLGKCHPLLPVFFKLFHLSNVM